MQCHTSGTGPKRSCADNAKMFSVIVIDQNHEFNSLIHIAVNMLNADSVDMI